MFVLHGWWRPADPGPGALVLWAEDSDLPAAPPRRPGRRPRVQDHPFACPPQLLAEWTGTRRAATCTAPRTAVLALPWDGRGPLPATELAAEQGVVDQQAFSRLAPWRLPVLEVDPDRALELLLAPEPVAGVLAGADLRYLAALAGFAVELAGRGQVLPTVFPSPAGGGGGQGMAVWRPLVAEAEAAWLRTVLGRAPACFRAAALPADPTDPAGSAAAPSASQDALIAAVTGALDDLTDAAVRSVVAAPARRGRRTWRDALAGRNRLFPAGPGQVAALDAGLRDWQREALTGGAVRACFRLVEPSEEQQSSWLLQLALQAAREPSLVVDAERVWRSQGDLRALARHVPDPQETLLAELGRAVRLYPELARAMRTATPCALELSTTAAHAFLVEVAPLLVASGFGVLLPGWWTNPAARLGARLRVSTPPQPGAPAAPAGIGQEGLAEFRWELAVGEHSLSEQELADLSAAQQPLVRVRGQWLVVDPDRLARARAFLLRPGQAAGTMSVGDVFRALGSADAGPGLLPVVDVQAEGWLADVLSGEQEWRLAPAAAPPAFEGELRPYQQRGLAWLTFLERAGLGAILADDMGLGKTVQLLALLAGDEPRVHPGAEPSPAGLPTLLVCPMSLVGNWQREAARFTPALRVHVHHGAERPRGKAFQAAVAASDLVLTTYALLARDAAALRKISWRRLVLDEAQAIKNAATKAAVAARSIPAGHRIAVTGTPVENRLGDLWSLMEFTNPRLLGPAAHFTERFAIPIERQGDPAAAARLRGLTQPFVLRRLKTDTTIISDLPAKLEMEIVCSLTGEQASLYQAVVADMIERIETTRGIERRGLVLATMSKLKQVCNHPAQFLRDGSRLAGRSGKLARLDEILEEVLAAGEKALLFTQYAEFGRMLQAHLAARFGREVAFLHGGVAKPDRDAMVTRFQSAAPGAPPLFVLSLKAGGTGLTLTAANHVVHVDRWWNPAVEDQATDRAFRIGQTRPVQVRKFVCAGTLEEKISMMIQGKRGLAASIVGTGEGWLTELSTAALRELFTLEAGASVE